MLARILGSWRGRKSEHKGERQKPRQPAAPRGRQMGPHRAPQVRLHHDGQPFEPEASALRQAAADVLTGKSLRSIAVDWTGRGLTTTRGNTFTSMQLRRTLINPLYAAQVTYQEQGGRPRRMEADHR